VTGLEGTTCEDFCQELRGSEDTSFIRTYEGEPRSRIIAASSNLTLMADLSPLCTGHLLLVSNFHYYSYAAVCRDHVEEVAQVTDLIQDLYGSTFGNPVVLEHGSSLDTSGSSCISHAHLHFLPVSADRVVEAMAEDGLKHADLSSLSDLVAYEQVPYYYVASAGCRRVYSIDRSMKQQYLRSVAGKILGIPDPEWDWALVIRKECLRASMLATAHWSLQE
jgi:diadenosine tetraphosphate (Ap4A) HIT family hydrolase